MDRGLSFYAWVTILSAVIIPVMIYQAFSTDVLVTVPADDRSAPWTLNHEYSSLDLVDTRTGKLVATLTDFVPGDVSVVSWSGDRASELIFRLADHEDSRRYVVYDGGFQMQLRLEP